LDLRLEEYTKKLSAYNEEALIEMKKVLWDDTSHWENLLYERAAISGKLVLSDFTKKALEKLKK
jgi:methylglutaconyl-CoA hydratase